MTHTFSPSILREYDIRGEVGKTLFEADAFALGKKFGLMLKSIGKNSVCVGRDGRLTSPMLNNALIEGLVASGATVTNIGIGPTPMTYFGLKTLNLDASIMVTGSHNPAQDNGFKFALQNRPFFGKDIQELASISSESNSNPTGTLRTLDISTAYTNRLLQDYEQPEATSPLRKIVWDVGNGATGNVLGQLIKGIPLQHILLNEEIDGSFPAHHPDPTVAENLAQLIATVRKSGADLGIAFDGDGDRIGVVDGEGRILWGDQLLLLLARDVVQNNPGATILADVKSTQVLFDEINRIGGNIIMTRTGHSLIKSRMAETGALLAGEMSGHVFYADKYYGYDDALYGAIRFINILQKEKNSLSQIINALPHFFNTPEIKINCSDERKFGVIDHIREQLEAEKKNVSTIDGVRVSSDIGWWLLRASNTQPVLIARCEATKAEDLKILRDEVSSYLAPHGLEINNG